MLLILYTSIGLFSNAMVCFVIWFGTGIHVYAWFFFVCNWSICSLSCTYYSFDQIVSKIGETRLPVSGTMLVKTKILFLLTMDNPFSIYFASKQSVIVSCYSFVQSLLKNSITVLTILHLVEGCIALMSNEKIVQFFL